MQQGALKQFYQRLGANMSINEESLYKFRLSAKKPEPPRITDLDVKKLKTRRKIEEIEDQRMQDSNLDYLNNYI